MKVRLDPPDKLLGGLYLSTSQPFVENSKAMLIHRVRTVSLQRCGKRPVHLAIHMQCGASHTGKPGKFTFLDAPPAGKLVCQACEVAVERKGLPSSDELVGHHVCKGGLKTYRTCCYGPV